MKKFLLGVLIALAASLLLVLITRGGLSSWSKGYEDRAARAKILKEVSPLRVGVIEYLGLQDDLPRYLSDMGFKISEMTSADVTQVQIAEDGKIVVLLNEGYNNWLAWAPEVSGLNVDWACTTNVNKYVADTCSFEDKKYARKKPSFNCDNAKTPVEKTICDHDRLMHSDNFLSAAYGDYLVAAGPDRAKEVREEQVEWLGQRDDWCAGLSEEKMLRCIDRETLARADCLREKVKKL